ncbi:4-oxalocrotonate tautomerase [Rhizobium sp. BK313]|jgi:4-oxalocrotonate tautomerase|uniref:tautomerase family protein n=1 Tax=Rhizobium sp. BK313 TaxID=2587081 RepID=UPI00106140B4|nr:4-oxalocrotonate tautomerase family protein [Rhizobium sp. BK313]MBB3458885.1 4-oxalocrotonate tautomerase [Rhizobium sp. BK313]
MPYVNIQVTREGTVPGATQTTAEQKAALIKGVSNLLFDVLGKPQNTTFVVINEVEMDSWGVGGLPVEDYRRQLAASKSK